MRRTLGMPLFLAVALALGLAGTPATYRAAAQEASPAAEMPAGFVAEGVALGIAASLPAAPALVLMDRLILPPDFDLPAEPGEASLALLVVESGTVTFVADAPLTITRAAALAASPGALPAQEQVAAGAEFSLSAGDSVLFPVLVGSSMRNDGDAPAVVLATAIVAAADLGVDLGSPTP